MSAPGQQQPSPLGPDEERAWLRRVVDADSARLSVLRAENGRLRRAIEHVINDSPGTPDSVKRYLREALAPSGKERGE